MVYKLRARKVKWMTKIELIEKLKDFPDSAIVCVGGDEWEEQAKTVELDAHSGAILIDSSRQNWGKMAETGLSEASGEKA